MCNIKQVLPSTIYKSEIETKDGTEEFIAADGNYFKAFHDVLLRKSHKSRSESDAIFIEPPHDGIVSIIFQYNPR
jgi:hypothetical protein